MFTLAGKGFIAAFYNNLIHTLNGFQPLISTLINIEEKNLQEQKLLSSQKVLAIKSILRANI